MEKKRRITRYLLYIAALLPLMLFREITPNNELRYLSIVDEALRDGHIFAFYNHGVPYADKPPLFFWLMMGLKLLFGRHIPFALSMLSVIPAFVTVCVFDRWCSRELIDKQRSAAAAMLFSCVYFIASAIVIRQDMMMTMFITLSLYTFYRMYEGDMSPRLKIAFPIYVFLALFSKGAVGILVPLVSIPVYLLISKEFKTIGRYWGWLTWGILILLCGGWFFAAWREGGMDYLNNLLFHQTVDRAVNAFHHKEPFWFYLAHVWYIIYPWAFAVVGVIVIALISNQKMSDLARFFVTVSVTIIVMLSLVSGKVDIYFLPAIGFLVYGAVMLFKKFRYPDFISVMLYIPAFVFAVAPVVVTILKKFIDIPYVDLFPIYVFLPLLIFGALACIFIRQGRLENGIISLAMSIYVTLFVFGFHVEKLNPSIGYRTLVEEAMQTANKEGITRFGVAVKEDGTTVMRRADNIDVYLGHEAEMIPEDTLKNSSDSIIGNSNGIIIFTRDINRKPTYVILKNSPCPAYFEQEQDASQL